jgi:branched-chain amino acid transport system substrate-binding protein
MQKYLFGLLTAAAALTVVPNLGIAADQPIRIGVITDMSGPYAAHSGIGVVRAVELAVKDFGGKVLNRPIEVLSADYQNKADIAATKARQWFDVENIDMLMEGTDSAAALAMQKVAAQKKKPIIFASSATTALTNADCSPYGIQYTYDTYSLAAATVKAVVAQGGDSWFFITVDQAFGKSIEADAQKVVVSSGGKVVGVVRHPLNTADYASFLLQAQRSKAKVVALANAGKDAQTAIRQAAEFGISKTQSLAPLLIYDTDVKGMGLEVAQGMKFTTAFYWDRTPETRKWSQRFFAIHKAMPTMIQAAAYSSTMHYLKAVEATSTNDADTVIERMRETPINDFFATNGGIRNDGRMVHDMYLAEVKKPSESKGEWDMISIISTIPGDQAFKPLSESTCSLVKKEP